MPARVRKPQRRGAKRAALLARLDVVAALVLLSACDGPGLASWRIRFASGEAPAGTVLVHGEVREGGCDGRVRFADDVRSGERVGMSPGSLPAGRYGFAAEARGTDCSVLADGCVELTIPTDEGIAVVLTPTAPRPACTELACSRGACAPGDLGADPGPRDAGTDAATDAGPRDAATDAATDAGPRDAGIDAATDAGPRDAATDAGPRDAATDAGPRDAGTDAGPRDAGTDAGPADLGPPDLGPPDLGPPDLGPPPGDVHVVITADNAYSFAYGSDTALTTFIRGTRASSAGEIFNCPVGVGPEGYTVPASAAVPGAYLYIITWDDLSITQGILGEFERDGSFVYTGDSRFEVCATGVDYSRAFMGRDPVAGPTQAVIEAEIARCNAGSGAVDTTSHGWVGVVGPVTPGAVGTVAVGEANNPTMTGEFPPVCAGDATTPGIDWLARWMWYAPPGLTGSAFRSTGSNTFRTFLIFRLRADQVVTL